MEPSILTIRDYGRIVVHLRELMDERGITRNYLARAINARFEVADKWYRGELEKIDADILARICFVLACNVEDILKYEPRKPEHESP